VRGDPGVGKTVLLDHMAGRALGWRAVGVQTEMELAFAGPHQLCGPMLNRAEHLPGPRCDALRTAFALQEGTLAPRACEPGTRWPGPVGPKVIPRPVR